MKTLEEVEEMLKTNENTNYGSMINVAVLFKKLYGRYPKIGLSGQQAAFADSVLDAIPEPVIKEPVQDDRAGMRKVRYTFENELLETCAGYGYFHKVVGNSNVIIEKLDGCLDSARYNSVQFIKEFPNE